MRHEHKVFEKLSQKTQGLKISKQQSKVDRSTENRHQGELSSGSTSPPESSSEDDQLCAGSSKPHRPNASFKHARSPMEHGKAQRSTPGRAYSKPHPIEKVGGTSGEVSDDSDDVRNVDVSVKRYGRTPRVVVRKRVVTCACRNH